MQLPSGIFSWQFIVFGRALSRDDGRIIIPCGATLGWISASTVALTSLFFLFWLFDIPPLQDLTFLTLAAVLAVAIVVFPPVAALLLGQWLGWAHLETSAGQEAMCRSQVVFRRGVISVVLLLTIVASWSYFRLPALN